jgi:hypothetical protein
MMHSEASAFRADPYSPDRDTSLDGKAARNPPLPTLLIVQLLRTILVISSESSSLARSL